MRYIFTFLLLICFGIANSTIFYVATTGNDATGNGSISQPWKTLSKATSTVTSAGNTIHVNAGTYLEVVQCFLSPGVNLEGDGVTSIIQSTWPWSFQGALVVESVEGTNGNQSISYLKFDGRSMTTPRGIQIQGRSNVSMHHCTIVDFKEEGIIISGTLGYTGFAPGIYATGNTFHDNIVTNCSQFAGYGTGCLGVGGQDGMLIYNNTITQLIRVGSYIGWPIKYFNEGWNKGMKIYNNTITKAPFDGNGWDFAIELFNQSGMEIYGNTIQGTLDFNFQTKGSYSYSIYIHDNTISQPVFNPRTEDGIIIEYSIEGLWVKNNIFRNLSTGIVFYTRQDATIKDIEITQNLFSNFGQSSVGGSVGAFIGGFGVGADRYTIDIFQVYNNTFAGLSTNNPGIGIGLGDCNTGFIRNVDIRNNSFQYITNDVFKIGGGITPSIVNFSYNNIKNITYNSSPTYSHTPTSYTGSPNFSFVPIFVNTINYALASNSPFIGAGQNVGYGLDLGYLPYNSAAAPTVTSVTPINGSTGVALNINPTGTFSTALASATVNTTNVTLTQAGNPITISVSLVSNVITITPAVDLLNNLPYVVTFKTSITSSVGTPLATQYTYSFTTIPSGGTVKQFAVTNIIFKNAQ